MFHKYKFELQMIAITWVKQHVMTQLLKIKSKINCIEQYKFIETKLDDHQLSYNAIADKQRWVPKFIHTHTVIFTGYL